MRWSSCAVPERPDIRCLVNLEKQGIMTSFLYCSVTHKCLASTSVYLATFGPLFDVFLIQSKGLNLDVNRTITASSMQAHALSIILGLAED